MDEINILKNIERNIIKHFGKIWEIQKDNGISSDCPKIVYKNTSKICKSSRRNTIRLLTAEWNNGTELNLSGSAVASDSLKVNWIFTRFTSNKY